MGPIGSRGIANQIAWISWNHRGQYWTLDITPKCGINHQDVTSCPLNCKTTTFKHKIPRKGCGSCMESIMLTHWPLGETDPLTVTFFCPISVIIMFSTWYLYFILHFWNHIIGQPSATPILLLKGHSEQQWKLISHQQQRMQHRPLCLEQGPLSATCLE